MKRLALGFLLIGAAALGQHNNRSARDLQFRFGNPGARSLGFGGAFIGLADDATAPVANPAGMARTSKRSFAMELGYERQDHPIPFQSGDILQTNIFEFDFNFTEGEAPDTIFQVPYLAAVFPVGNWRFGAFAHQQANLSRRYRTEEIIICDLGSGFYPNCAIDPNPTRYPASTDVLELEIVNAGGSAALQAGRFVALGVSVYFSDLDYQADSVVEYPVVQGTALVNQLARGQDDDWGLAAGALFEISPELSLGVTYKRQPEFTYRATLTKSQPLPGLPPDFDRNAPFKIPDSLGFGASFRPWETVTVNLDANRVYYSQITDDLLDFTQVRSAGRPVRQTMADVTEIHVGFEWILVGRQYPLSLRVGYWLDPYHAAINNVADSQLLEEGDSDNVFVRDIFFLNRFEEDENHYAAGLGWSFGAKFQFDLAVEIAENSRIGTLSGVYRF